MSKIIYKFEEFSLLENGSPGFATSGGYPQSSNFNSQVNDYSLSSNPSDTYAAGMKSSIFKLTSIISDLISNGGLQIGHQSDFSDIEKIEEFKILRMYKNVKMLLDIYVTFVVDDVEYWGVFRDYGGFSKSIFKSEAHMCGEYTRNFLMKLEGILLKALDRFYTPKKGMYKLYTNTVVQDKYGVKHTILKDKSVKVEDVINDKQDSYIQIDVKTGRNDNETFYLKGIDYYYFNYWFGDYTVEDIKK